MSSHAAAAAAVLQKLHVMISAAAKHNGGRGCHSPAAWVLLACYDARERMLGILDLGQT